MLTYITHKPQDVDLEKMAKEKWLIRTLQRDFFAQ